MVNIVLCGIGGQGTVLASKLIAAAAMKKNIPVMSAETIGMAQRGGSVFSHLRMGEEVASPMIAKGEADLIIGFEPGETVRMLPYLKKDGQVITAGHAIMPVTASLAAVMSENKSSKATAISDGCTGSELRKEQGGNVSGNNQKQSASNDDQKKNTVYDGSEMLEYLKKTVKNLTIVDTDTACKELGSSKVMNVLMLGYAARSGALGLSVTDIKEALKERLKESLWELNFRALEYDK